MDIEEENLNPGGEETLLLNVPVKNYAIERIALAPGQGRTPMDVTTDADAEELSFPINYCGMKRESSATYSKIARSEIRRSDRRCARLDKLLWTYRFYELTLVKGAISTCLRKKSGTQEITAGNMVDANFVHNLVQHDEGYHILKGLRSSSAYWEAEKKKVLAMIRQFELPTFFITLSAAEAKWNEVLIILSTLGGSKRKDTGTSRKHVKRRKGPFDTK